METLIKIVKLRALNKERDRLIMSHGIISEMTGDVLSPRQKRRMRRARACMRLAQLISTKTQ